MGRALGLLIVVCGCDAVLRLQEVSAPADGSGDGASGACNPGRDDTMDEDCDGYPDPDDLCPAEADTMPAANADVDGAGDLCDPSAAPGDAIRMFDGFGAAALQNWSATKGTWHPVNGALVNDDFDGTIAHDVVASHMLAEVYVDARDVGTSATFSLELADALSDHFRCVAVVTTMGASVRAETDNSSAASSQIAGIGQMRLELFDEDQSGNLRCRITFVASGKTIDRTTSIALGTPIQARTLTLTTSALHAVVDSVTVVGRP